ncbi:MAG: thiamine phosphate synthase [Candidatus Binataceae bacterium]
MGDDAARRPRFRLYLITDRTLCAPRELPETCDEVLSMASREFARGSIALQLREKDLSAHQLLNLALRLRESCTRTGTALLINDRIDVALAADADGVHLPANSFSVADARALLGPAKLIGVSAHGAASVADAAADGADFAVFGPVYPPISKSTYGPPRGLEELGAAMASVSMPVYALGGITAQRTRDVMRASGGRAGGVAVIGSVFDAISPAGAAREILIALGAARQI